MSLVAFFGEMYYNIHTMKRNLTCRINFLVSPNLRECLEIETFVRGRSLSSVLRTLLEEALGLGPTERDAYDIYLKPEEAAHLTNLRYELIKRNHQQLELPELETCY